MASANYYAVIDPDSYLGCRTCMDRCEVHAISEHEEVAVVDRNKRIGCELCVRGCPNNVAILRRKPANQIVDPPADFTWEHERLMNRGLIE